MFCKAKFLFVPRSTQNTEIPCDHNVEFLNVKPVVDYRISRSIRRAVIFSLEILQKNYYKCILILAIHWKKT